jgi:hypothetical protein
MFSVRGGTAVGVRVGVAGSGVGVAVGLLPPQAARNARTTNRLEKASINRRKGIAILPARVRFMA